MTDSTLLFPRLREEMLPGGGHRSFVLKRGQMLRLTDLRGGANVSLTLLNANEKTERPEPARRPQMPAHRQASPRPLPVLGRGPRAGRHHRRHLRLGDSLGGVLCAEEVAEKYGQGRYQELRNGFFRNGTDNLLVELGKWGWACPTC